MPQLLMLFLISGSCTAGHIINDSVNSDVPKLSLPLMQQASRVYVYVNLYLSILSLVCTRPQELMLHVPSSHSFMRRPLPRSKNHRTVCLTRSTHSTQSSEGAGSEEEGGSGLGSLRHGYYSSRGMSLEGISRYSSRLMVSLSGREVVQ